MNIMTLRIHKMYATYVQKNATKVFLRMPLDLDAFKSHGINRLNQNCNNIFRELITHYFEFYPRKSSIIYNMKALNKIFTK